MNDLRIKELPTQSHQPVSMAHCRGQRYIEDNKTFVGFFAFCSFVSRNCATFAHIFNNYTALAKIIVQNTEITVLSHNDKDYI